MGSQTLHKLLMQPSFDTGFTQFSLVLHLVVRLNYWRGNQTNKKPAFLLQLLAEDHVLWFLIPL